MSRSLALLIPALGVLLPGCIAPARVVCGDSAPRSFINSIGMELTLIPAGSFYMGSMDTEPARSQDEGPQHRVTLPRAFYVSTCEVTNAHFKLFIARSGYDGLPDADKDYLKHLAAGSPYCSGEDDHPVTFVSSNNAIAFCEWLSQTEERTYRLPTEAQWEYACRAGTIAPRYGDLEAIAWYENNSSRVSHVVRTKQPNAWGLYDMLGNAREWVADWKGDYSSDGDVNPQGPPHGELRVERGGGFGNFADFCRAANRNAYWPWLTMPDLGFRIVLESTPAPGP